MPSIRLITSTKSTILLSLRDSLRQARTAVFAVAFVTSRGTELLRPELESFLKRDGSLQFYATLDGGVFTQPDFCRLLLKLERRYPETVEVYLYPHSSSLFHAKVFLFERKDGTWFGLVGSANLTEGALLGNNFEVAAACDPISHDEVKRFRNELSELRVRSAFHRLTDASLFDVINAYQGQKEESGGQGRSVAAKAKRESALRVLRNAAPTELPPLPPLSISPRACVEAVCDSGVGVAIDDDLADLSVTLDFGSFIRAGILAKESTRMYGILTATSRKGHSFSLIDNSVRQKVKKARNVIGKTIGLRAVDFGYLRWVPQRFFGEALYTTALRLEVKAAQKAVQHDNKAITKHLEKVRRNFRGDLRKVVAELKIEPQTKWRIDVATKFAISASASKNEVRKRILNVIINTHQDRIADSFVRSQLARLMFVPRCFAFPLMQRSALDEDYGHKHFLANLVFACTDRLLRKSNELGGRGVVFEYLNERRKFNESRHHQKSSAALAERAAAWLKPKTSLATAVQQFQLMYGPESFTWDLTDLAKSLEPSSAAHLRAISFG
jgi:HKD family nuclease